MDLVAGSGIRFEDLGRHPLKGVPGGGVAVRCDRRPQAGLGMTHKVDEATSILHSVCARFHEGVDNLDLSEARTVLEELVVDREN